MSMIDNLIGFMGIGALLVITSPLYQTRWLAAAINRVGLVVLSLSAGALIGSVWMGAQ